MSRKFDKQAYKQFDKSAKDKLVEFLPENSYINHEPFGPYGVDFHINVKDFSFYADVEVRRNWESGEFPYRTINLPLRKGKFASIGSIPTLFFSFRLDLEDFIIIPGSKVKGTHQIFNTWTREYETFYTVPVDECVTKEQFKEWLA